MTLRDTVNTRFAREQIARQDSILSRNFEKSKTEDVCYIGNNVLPRFCCNTFSRNVLIVKMEWLIRGASSLRKKA